MLELLDKVGAPSFSAADTVTLGLFANQAAVAIEQSRLHRNLGALLAEAVRALGSSDDPAQAGLGQGARDFPETLARDDPAFRRALELAVLVRDIAGQGEREYNLCRSVLQSFAEYARSRPDSLESLDWP